MNQPQQQQQAAATALPSCFKSKQQMIDAAGSEGLVCLHFPASTDKANLYAHKSFLRCCSGVMKTLLDEDSFLVSPPQQQQPSKVAKLEAGTTAAATAATAAAAADADASVPVIPVTDADTIAWEEALALVYPMPPGAHSADEALINKRFVPAAPMRRDQRYVSIFHQVHMCSYVFSE
jgi:hypothetical protein